MRYISIYFKQDKIDNKQNQSINDFLKNCKICSFVNSNRVNIFYYLIQLVKPDDINQTNISCINTSLIILIIEYDKGKLAEFLEVFIYNYLEYKEDSD